MAMLLQSITMRSFRFVTRSSLVAIVAIVLAPACMHASPEDDQLEAFLTRLGLVDLQTVHMEQALARETDESERLGIARRLADVYAGQLLANSENAERYDTIVQKINKLLADVPAAKTSLLEVMLLQADYYRAETLVGKWIADRSDTTSGAEARVILDRIAPELNRLHTELNEKYEKLVEKTNEMEAGAALDLKEKELTRLQAIVGRASYFAAWSNYYGGLVADSDASFEIALRIFRELLSVGDTYEDVEAEYLGLESIWRARTLIGLALTEAALDHTEESDACFELLQHNSVPPQLRDQVGYWKLQSLFNGQRYGDAIAFAEKQIAAFKGVSGGASATQGQVSFCVSLLQAAFAGGVIANDQSQRLASLGLGGLIKIGQRGTAKQLMAKYDINPDGDAGFYLQWLHGQQLFEAAEKSKKPEDYATAAAKLTEALRDPVAKDDLGSAGQCRSQLAWCRYRQEEFDAAGREFQLAAERLIAARDERAIDSAWMSFVSFQAASKSAPRYKDAAIDMLNMIKREFPEHAYAKRADFYIGKLRQSSSPSDTLRSLEKVTSDSPDYLSARYEIILILYQQWAKAGASDKAAIAQKLFDATDTYLGLAATESDKSRLVRALNQAANVALSGSKPDVSLANKYLQTASAFSSSLPTSSVVLAEHRFQAMQLAQREGDALQERLHAGWLVDNAAGSRYELAAIIVMARVMDKKVASSSSTAATDDVLEAFALYQRLVELLGDSPEAIRASKNTRVANSKLASYATQLGKHELAASCMKNLLEASDGPPSKSYLRRAGLASFAAKNYEESIGHWRTLVRGVSKGSDEWFEAKYHQLACLFQIDPDTARIVYDQFELLYPDLGPVAWRGKFADLVD